MATFASSVINKSGKKFVPKAPVRRAGGASTFRPQSAKPAVDLQTSSTGTTKPTLVQSSISLPSPPPQLPVVLQHETLPPSPQAQINLHDTTSPPSPTSVQKQSSRQTSPHPSSYVPTSNAPTNASIQELATVSDSRAEEASIVNAPPLESFSQTLSVTPATHERDDSLLHEPASKRRRIDNETEPDKHPVEGESSLDIDELKRPPAPIDLNSNQDGATGVRVEHPDTTVVLQSIVAPPQNEETSTPQRKRKSDKGNNSKTDEMVLAAVANDTQPPKRRPRSTRKKAVTASSTDGTESHSERESEAQEVAVKPRRSRTKKANHLRNVEDVVDAIVDDAFSGRKNKSKKRSLRRSKTPENAEDIEIVPGKIKMSDLCKDLHLGKRSNREKELEKMDWTAVVKKQKELEAKRQAGELPPQETVDEKLQRVENEKSRHAPRMRIVNGEIVLDDSSLQVDRHAEAAENVGELEEIEENQLTRRVNQASWMKREKGQQWSKEATDLFYKGLRMFGTEFMMISKLFPDRTRRQIKLKFNNEERENPHRIENTLRGPRELVDMEEYARVTNTVYEDVSVHEKRLAEDRKLLEQELARQKEAQEQSRREREEQLRASGAVGQGDAEKHKKKKNKAMDMLAGEEVEVLGTIEELGQEFGLDE